MSIQSLMKRTQRWPQKKRHLEVEAIPNVSALIARVLSDEGYYGNGDPTWLNAPRAKEAKKARKTAAKRLRYFADDFPGAGQLADILTHCRPRHRCMSGACPQCGRAFQRWLVGQVTKLAEANPTPLSAVSIAIAEHRTPESQLHTLHTTGMKRALAYTLGKVTGINWVAGGIDLSLNDDTQKGSDIGWLPQLYGFVATSDIDTLSNLLRKRYPKTDQAPRPVQIKRFDGAIEAFSYAFKPGFVKRIAYKDSEKNRWDTRKVYLSPKHHVQAMLWMHKIGLSGRLFLKNIRMTRNGHHVELLKIRKLE